METPSSDDAIDHATKFLAEQEQQPNDIAAKEHKERIGRQLSQLFAILAFFRGDSFCCDCAALDVQWFELPNLA